jgi:hypothetical protein
MIYENVGRTALYIYVYVFSSTFQSKSIVLFETCLHLYEHRPTVRKPGIETTFAWQVEVSQVHIFSFVITLPH